MYIPYSEQICSKHSAFTPHCQLRDKQTYVLGLEASKEREEDTTNEVTHHHTTKEEEEGSHHDDKGGGGRRASSAGGRRGSRQGGDHVVGDRCRGVALLALDLVNVSITERFPTDV